ncbi:TetR/AcrR family transcriptional regulator C-terminal ligand-binding domain-containing protein [Actinoallomurus sp. NBC_01490]|jgi:AcrR family transcriptional regulator|uniref:TetR-like C-terminal domain-containing protein n=1 Tax=Actinoallomurus sp. NBC_01490 TaxID=2903557 RepID=UPI002E3471A1|nr:TetR-like C-terminal domain-containing protein [Actinoallomurus sp. NBC_01490]
MATQSNEVTRATRRRGAVLTRAIFEATLAELAEGSFEELAFDKIAARAATGKAALYRRWDTPAELVLDALADPVAGFEETTPPRTGTLRGDLVALLTGLAHALDEPRGRALRPLMTQRDRHPDLYARVRDLVVLPRQQLMTEILAAAAARGEIRADAVNPRVAGVGPRLVIASHMDTGTVPTAEVTAIVDEVLIPLLRP